MRLERIGAAAREIESRSEVQQDELAAEAPLDERPQRQVGDEGVQTGSLAEQMMSRALHAGGHAVGDLYGPAAVIDLFGVFAQGGELGLVQDAGEPHPAARGDQAVELGLVDGGKGAGVGQGHGASFTNRAVPMTKESATLSPSRWSQASPTRRGPSPNAQT